MVSTEEAKKRAAAKQEAFENAIKKLNKDWKKKHADDDDPDDFISKLSATPRAVETISSGSLVLDGILGGGFPIGRMIEIYGPEASGKTSIALTAVGNVQRNGGTAALIDLEQALDPNYAAKLGVDIPNLAVAQPGVAEDALDLIEDLMETGVVDIIVVDSISALAPRAQVEGSADTQTIGLLARLLSTTLRKFVSIARKTRTTIIFINQEREAIGGFSPRGTPKTTTGGKALKYFASQRVRVARTGEMKDGSKTIGSTVKLKVHKNKIAPPGEEGETVLTFDRGINVAAEMIQSGPDYEVIERPNNRTYIEAETGEVIGKSKAEAVEKLETDQEMVNRLSAAIDRVIKKRREGGPNKEDSKEPDSSDEKDKDFGEENLENEVDLEEEKDDEEDYEEEE